MMRRLTLAALACGLAVLALAAAACGGGSSYGGSSSASPTRPAATAAASGTTPQAGGAQGQTVTVVAKDFSFTPGEVKLSGTGSVTFMLDNQGSAPHTFTVYRDEDHTQLVGGTGNVSGGQKGTVTVTLDKSGDYYFRCEIHPTQMQGEIKVP
jgi:plastocyanin